MLNSHPLPTGHLEGRAPYRPERMAGQSPRQHAGLRLVSSLRTNTTTATPRRTSSGTNTSGYAATNAKPMRVAGTTNIITAVGRSLRSTLLAIRTRAASAAAAQGCRSGHLPYERWILRPQPTQICPVTRLWCHRVGRSAPYTETPWSALASSLLPADWISHASWAISVDAVEASAGAVAAGTRP